MGDRYVYEHPAEAGVGEHHAELDALPLAERSADRHGAEGAPQHPAQESEVTMADLDLAHGTEVELLSGPGGDPAWVEAAEDSGLVYVGWTDSRGTSRVTSLEPAFFAEHFSQKGA
jgi:hypothetical protein